MLRTERIFSGSAGSYWDVAERVGSTTTTRYIMGVFRGGQGNHATPPPSIVDWVDFIWKNGFVGTVLSTRSFLWTSNMPKMRWRPGSAPDPAGGAHDAPPGSLVGWGGEHPLPNPYHSRRLLPRFSRLRSSASVHPNVKPWLRPCDIYGMCHVCWWYYSSQPVVQGLQYMLNVCYSVSSELLLQFKPVNSVRDPINRGPPVLRARGPEAIRW